MSAWTVSLLAYALYLYQALSHVQFADKLQKSSRVLTVIVGLIFGWMLGMLVIRLDTLKMSGAEIRKLDYVPIFAGLFLLVSVAVTGGVVGVLSWWLTLVIAAVGFVLMWLLAMMAG